MKRATVADGKIILSEANHDTPAGATIATINFKGSVCTITIMGDDGTPGPAGQYTVDHLGAKYYDARRDGSPFYVLYADNWKLYQVRTLAWIKSLFR